jgi:hypothetical protein
MIQAQLGILPPFYLLTIAAVYRTAEPLSPTFLVLAHKYMYFALGDMKTHLKRNEIVLKYAVNFFIGRSFL